MGTPLSFPVIRGSHFIEHTWDTISCYPYCTSWLFLYVFVIVCVWQVHHQYSVNKRSSTEGKYTERKLPIHTYWFTQPPKPWPHKLFWYLFDTTLETAHSALFKMIIARIFQTSYCIYIEFQLSNSHKVVYSLILKRTHLWVPTFIFTHSSSLAVKPRLGIMRKEIQYLLRVCGSTVAVRGLQSPASESHYV